MFIVPVAVLMMMVIAAVSYTAWWSHHQASLTVVPRGGQHTAEETFVGSAISPLTRIPPVSGPACRFPWSGLLHRAEDDLRSTAFRPGIHREGARRIQRCSIGGTRRADVAIRPSFTEGAQ